MNEKINTLQKIGNWISTILLGNTREVIARIDERTLHMQEDIKDMKPKVDDMFPKMDILWKNKAMPAHSPRQLNDEGLAIFKESGIKQVIDEKKDVLLAVVRAQAPQNAYDAERVIFAVVQDLTHDPEIVDRLKPGAFKTGADIITVLLVGGIYLRDLIFPDLGFSIDGGSKDR